MDEDDQFFARGHNGYFMEDFVLHDRDGYATELFECKDCAALVKDPQKHIEWHTRK